MNIENRVALGLGGNMGNRLYHIAWAQQLITKNIGQIIQCSPLYQTAAWGNTDQPPFLNQVIVVITPFTPLQTLQKCHTSKNLWAAGEKSSGDLDSLI